MCKDVIERQKFVHASFSLTKSQLTSATFELLGRDDLEGVSEVKSLCSHRISSAIDRGPGSF